MKRVYSVFTILLCIFFLGCATTPTTQPTIPIGCENALVYKIPNFMPNGPMITRVSVSTALAVANTAGHPEVRLVVATVMPMLYRATLTNTLGSTISMVQEKFNTPNVFNYVTPFFVLFDSLNQGGVLKAQLTECDKNILASLFKNIGLDSGTDPALFQ